MVYLEQGMNNSPDVILFDMDDTILDDTGGTLHCWEMACNRYANQLGDVSPAVLLAAIEDYRRWYWSDAERHRLGRMDLAQARREIVVNAVNRLGFDAPAIAYQIADFHTDQRDKLIAPFAGALDTLKRLQNQGLRLGLITNGNTGPQRAKIDRFGLAVYFDCILIEGEFGIGKPDLRTYSHALNLLGATPDRAWMVGDNLEWDVAAPQRLGIFGIWNDFSGTGLPATSPVRPDRIIRTINEFV